MTGGGGFLPEDLTRALERRHLTGAVLAVAADDPVPAGTRALLLLSPHEPGFWADARTAAEFADGAPDPLDRFSRRMIEALAAELGAAALFPFGGPPYAPFLGWALRSGRFWSSPLGLLVSRDSGLFVSFRGALALPEAIDMPADTGPSPCADCRDRPCLTACPAAAFGPEPTYDAAACHACLDTAAGRPCMQLGCAARRACPFSQNARRDPAQSAFHMKAFHPCLCA